MAEYISFSAMTWNLENWFPPDDPGGAGPRNKAVYEKKAANIVRTIQAIAPDVIGLQEIGNPDALRDLQGRLRGRYPFTKIARKPDPRGIRNAYLSRLPLLQAQEFSEFPATGLNTMGASNSVITTMGRTALKATVVLSPGLLVNMMNVHLKSKLVTYANGRFYPNDEDERARGTGLALLRRAAEAVAVRVWLNQLMTANNEPMLLLGDFNDTPEAVTTQIMLGPEDRSLSNRDKFDDVRLYDLADYIPADRRYSRLYHKQREMIDHIAVSHELIFYLRKADSYIEPIENIDQNVDSRRDATFPDHAPIYARFEIPEDEADRHFSINREPV
jgi:endonuclease/exonuclease/phosphatase family metal-dependent hydrolase